MGNLLLTIDAGSSGCRAEVFDLAGRSLSHAAFSYEADVSQPGRAELDPATLRSAVASAVQQALASIDVSDLAGVAVSAQLGLVPVDAGGRPLRNIITWMDRRAVDEAAEFADTLGPETIYRVTGRRVDPEWPACKILHLKKHEPNVYRDTHCFLSVKDYLVQQLTGEFVIDLTHASYSMLFNVETGAWQQDFFEALKLDPGKMARLVPSPDVAGECGGPLARELGLPAGLPVIVGGPDGTGGSLGAGLIDEGLAVNVVGTTDVFFTCAGKPIFDPRMRTLVNCHVVPGKWVIGGPMSLTGGCLEWCCSQFVETGDGQGSGDGESVYARLDREAENLPPGSGPLCLPGLTGQRTPFWSPNARGVLAGLSPQHGQAHVYRAILEGSAFSLRALLAILEEQGIGVERVNLVGGAAKSRLWAQIRADVLGRPVTIPAVSAATGLGSAILLAVGLGLHGNFEDAVSQMVEPGPTFEPDPRNHATYEHLSAAHAKLRLRLDQSFDELAAI